MSTNSHKTQEYCFKKLKGFDAIGFDLDFTLGRYNTLNLMKLIHKEMVAFLVQNQGYPTKLLDTSFDDNIAQKGLCLDKTNGLLLKVDQDLRVVRASFGRNFLKQFEVESYYPEPLSAPTESDTRFYTFNGPWTVPMMSILADYIEIEGLQREATSPSVWEKLSDDVTRSCYALFYAVDYPKPLIESNFPILKEFKFSSYKPGYFASVIENMEKYFSKCDRLRFIEELRAAGFKTFIVTDARFEFADVALRFLFGEDYNRLFDIILTHAAKPRTFFNPNHRFVAAGTMQQDGFYLREEVSEEVRWDELKAFHTFGEGNKVKLTEFLSKQSDIPPENLKILYVGDSIRSDIKSMKREEKYDWTYVWVQSDLDIFEFLDHSFVKKHAELNTITSDWGNLLTTKLGLSYFGAEVKEQADYVMSDVLELGGTKNPIKSDEFFELVESNLEQCTNSC